MNRHLTDKVSLPSATHTIIYLIVIYIVGIAGMLATGTLPIFRFLVPVNILLATTVAAFYHPDQNKRLLFSALVTYIGGFVIEWLGVKTGLIFGSYKYGEALGLKVDGVPIIMGINWLLLVYGATVIASRFFKQKLIIALTGATLMLMYDFFLEPAAIRYGFWDWGSEQVPAQNYLAWFISAFVFIVLFMVLNQKRIKNKVAEAIFWLQLAFFVCLWVGNNLML